MKRKPLLLLFFIVPLLSSCLKGIDTAAVSRATLPAALLKSDTFHKFMMYDLHVHVALLSGKYNMSHVDMKYVEANDKGLHSTKELIAVYQKAGMDNATDYVNNTLRTARYFARLNVEIPLTRTLSSKEFVPIAYKVYFETMHMPKPDYVKIRAQKKIAEQERASLQEMNLNKKQ